MKYAALLFAGFVLAGCDGLEGQTLPDGVTAAEVATFKSAVSQAGCAVETTAQGEAIADATGLNPIKLRDITQYLVLAGESEPTASGFRLTSGTCANA